MLRVSLTLLCSSGVAALAVAGLLRSQLRSTRSHHPFLRQEWTLSHARTALSPETAEIIGRAWEEDKELRAFLASGGSLHSKPHIYADESGGQVHTAIVWAANGTAQASSLRPGVLLVHTAVGPQDLFLRWTAQRLAREGYAVLIADLLGDPHGDGWDPMWAVPRRQAYAENRSLLGRRTRLAMEQLAAHPLVDASRIAAVGYCFGGRAVLDLLKLRPPGLRAVVSFHGVLDDYTPPASDLRIGIGSTRGADEEAAVARALICHADADPFTRKPMLEALLAQLTALGSVWELQLFGEAHGARHGFTNPAQSLNTNPAFSYDDRAARHSWTTAKEFLSDALAENDGRSVVG
jgi:dienelactone hydrolase